MPFWVIALIILAATTALSFLLRPKVNQEKQKAAGLSDIDFPTATEAQEISVIRGRVKFKQPNCGWAGDFATEAITQQVPGGFLGLGKKNVETGQFRYYVGMQLYICHGGDFPIALREIQIDDKVAWTGNLTSGTGTVNQPELFGGEKKEGGYQFNFEWYGGSWSQTQNSYLAAQVGGGYIVPNYRGIAHLVTKGSSDTVSGKRGGYIGNSTNIKPFSFVLQCCPQPHASFDASKSVIGSTGDYNPAYFIYEWLTNSEWGLGAADELIDFTAFQAAANTLHTEGFGMSVQENSARKIRSIIQDVQKLIDGVVYFERLTNKWTIKLIRPDYDIGTLPVFDETNVVEYTKFNRVTYTDSVNHVIIKYIDKALNYKERPIDFKNTANFRIQGEVIKTELSMYGCCDAALAGRIAYREGRIYSTNIADGQIKVNREAHFVRPGTPFKLKRTMPDGTVDIPEIVVRALKVDDGDFFDSVVTVDYVEDIFSIGSISYTTPTPPSLPALITAPSNVTNAVVMEQPYIFSGSEIRVMAFAAKPNGSHLNYDLYISTDGGTLYQLAEQNVDFCPLGTLDAGITNAASSMVLNTPIDLSRLVAASDDDIAAGYNLIYFATTGEIAAFKTATIDTPTAGKWTIDMTGWRGILDTAAAAHSAGEKIYFFTYGQSLPNTAYGSGLTIKFKFVTRTPVGDLALGSASVFTL